MIHYLLYLLLYVAEVLSSLNHREKWTIPESNFITLQGILNHTFEAPTRRPNNHSHHIPGRGSGPPQVTAGLYPVLLPVGVCEKPNYEGWGKSTCQANQVMGLPLTIFHDMWLVLWKHLTTTTTHCDLSQFINTDGVHSQVMIHNPVRDPYGDCRISKHSTPMSCEWQEITRLLPVLLAEHLLGTDWIGITLDSYMSCI